MFKLIFTAGLFNIYIKATECKSKELLRVVWV